MGYRDNDGEAYSHAEACIASRHVSTYRIWHKQAISFVILYRLLESPIRYTRVMRSK